jgi:D-alanine-D-alanine ligase
MRIALTYNLRRSRGEAHAELDTAATIRAIATVLGQLGHAVTRVEVSGPLERVIGRLRALAPDLVFNLAEGLHGTFREAVWPAVFEQLHLPHTGSGPSVLAVCLDKALANRLVAAAGVRVPRGQLVRAIDELGDVAPPLIVKPNFEGSSKGLSLVTGDARAAVADVLARYPAGVLVEEYVEGADVAIGWVEGLGILPAIHYVCDQPILDRAAKLRGIPVEIAPVSPALRLAAERAFAALGVAGYGRADFRITPDGEPVFLEMNPLPSLDPAEGDLYSAAEAMGVSRLSLIDAIATAGPPRRGRRCRAR